MEPALYQDPPFFQEPALYGDGSATITITATEIRTQGFTIFLRNVTSVSIGTVRPGRWAPLIFSPLMVMALVPNFTSAPFHRASSVFLLPILPLVIGIAFYFFIRVNRLTLQTAGGPIVLAHKISLAEPTETLEQYERIKLAIERAVSNQVLPDGP